MRMPFIFILVKKVNITVGSSFWRRMHTVSLLEEGPMRTILLLKEDPLETILLRRHCSGSLQCGAGGEGGGEIP